MPESNVLIPENGAIIEVNRSGIKKNGNVIADQVLLGWIRCWRCWKYCIKR